MPCNNGNSEYIEELEKENRQKDPILFSAQNANNLINKIADMCVFYKERSDQLANMLCRLCKQMDDLSHADCSCLDMADEDIMQWWLQHKKWDEERKK